MDSSILIHHFTRSKGITEKRKLHARETLLPIDVFAVYNSRFVRMQLKSALPKTATDLTQRTVRLRQALAMSYSVFGRVKAADISPFRHKHHDRQFVDTAQSNQ